MLVDENFKQRLRRLFSVMIPILITQTAIMAMNFFDSSMSGHAGAVDLAGTSIGGNIWMPIFVGTNGVLLGAMPIVAHLLGADKRDNIGKVIRHTIFLAIAFSAVIILMGVLFLDTLLTHLHLEPQVHYIAKMYMAAVAVGVIPFFMSTSLRALIDTLGHTGITMKIYLLALPVNAFLNYCFIFGKLGMPRLGGVGAGVATGITYWLEFAIFVWIVHKLPAFEHFRIFKDRFHLDIKQLRENLSIGVPIGLAMFMEASIFGVVALFIAKFGTVIIAAHQAALGFTSLLYMVPLSFSMALTILVGVEAGAKRFGLRSPEGSKEVSAPLFRRNKMLLLRSPGQNPAVQCCEVPCSGKKLSSQSAVYVAEDRLPPDSGRNQKSPPGSPCICSRKKIPLFSVCCTPGNTVHRSSQDCPAVLLPSDAGSLRMLFF